MILETRNNMTDQWQQERAHFPLLQQKTYLAAASTGLVPDYIYRAMRDYQDRRYLVGGDLSWNGMTTLEMMDWSKQMLADMLGAKKENIAFAVGWGTYYGNRTNAFEVLNDGSAALKGSLSQSSDIRLKENVKNLESKGSLRLVEFDWKDGRGHSYGFIADEVEKVYPDMVSEDSSGYKVLNYNAALCAKLAELEATIRKQQEMIDKLEKLIQV